MQQELILSAVFIAGILALIAQQSTQQVKLFSANDVEKAQFPVFRGQSSTLFTTDKSLKKEDLQAHRLRQIGQKRESARFSSIATDTPFLTAMRIQENPIKRGPPIYL